MTCSQFYLSCWSCFFRKGILDNCLSHPIPFMCAHLIICIFNQELNGAWLGPFCYSIVGRHRWVEYASKNRYNASQVPPEWHGWLHHITDHTGDEVDKAVSTALFNGIMINSGDLSRHAHLMMQLLLLKPKRYGVEHRENFSGEGDEYIYHSKGHTLNPGQRNWTRYESWQPKKE